MIATLILAVILCGVYPLVVTGVGQLLFPKHSAGSLLRGPDGKIVGSQFIGQGFSKPEYFHGRPSAAGDKGYDAANSSGSNLGPTNQKLFDTLKSNIEGVMKENPNLKKGKIPVDLVTASASGLDPHISPEAALVQVDRVAKAREMAPSELIKLVENSTEGPEFGVLGESVVNVLMLNMELDRVNKK